MGLGMAVDDPLKTRNAGATLNPEAPMKKVLLLPILALALAWACPSWAAGAKGGSFGGRSGGSSGHSSRPSSSVGSTRSGSRRQYNGKLFTFASRGELAIDKARSSRSSGHGKKPGSSDDKDNSADSNTVASIVSGFGRPLPEASQAIATGYGRPLQAPRPSLLKLPPK